jgi:hypothetical protein
MMKIIIKPLDFYKIEYIIKSMKTMKGGEAVAAKVRLEGDVKLELEVKYGLNEDLTIKVHAIPLEVDGKVYKVLVGEGDISHIPEKTLSFVGERIESLLKKDKTLIGVDGWGELFRYGYFGKLGDDNLSKALFKTELGGLLLKAYKRRDTASLEEVVRRGLWFVSRTGMKEFVSWKKALEKAKEKDIPFSTIKNVKELL